ncbi:MAG: 5-methylcytosine-specific restriction endonuclease system specificity protein McrC, partial [Candidatus Cloacimonetes bacterium]|nr:5-methylcytosine-specific restriction endonuclease system specificity protein McrC [Candidatus Cloacimonadota bacterium]
MSKNSTILIKNIYYMLSYAYHNLQQNNYDDIQTEDFENIYDLLALILAKGMTEQLKHGFYREYVEVNDNLSTIRGKVNLKESYRLKMQEKLKMSCSYDELSENNFMNQILKSTLMYLIYHRNVQRKNKDILKKVLPYLANIDKIDFKSIKMNSVHFTRHNSTYKMLVNICVMVLNECLQTSEDGHN